MTHSVNNKAGIFFMMFVAGFIFLSNKLYAETTKANSEIASLHPSISLDPNSVTGDPNETIDHYKGGLALKYTDISLPGNGGMDLNLIRRYQSKSPIGGGLQDYGRPYGFGWSFDYGRVYYSEEWSTDCDSGGDELNHCDTTLIFEDMNGVSHELHTKIDNFNYKTKFGYSYPSGFQFVSTDNWKAERTQVSYGNSSFKITSPDGAVYIANVFSTEFQRDYYADYYYVSKITDKNGNQININYEPLTGTGSYSKIGLLGRKIKSVTADDGRRIDFTYRNYSGPATPLNNSGVWPMLDRVTTSGDTSSSQVVKYTY